MLVPKSVSGFGLWSRKRIRDQRACNAFTASSWRALQRHTKLDYFISMEDYKTGLGSSECSCHVSEQIITTIIINLFIEFVMGLEELFVKEIWNLR